MLLSTTVHNWSQTVSKKYDHLSRTPPPGVSHWNWETTKVFTIQSLTELQAVMMHPNLMGK